MTIKWTVLEEQGCFFFLTWTLLPDFYPCPLGFCLWTNWTDSVLPSRASAALILLQHPHQDASPLLWGGGRGKVAAELRWGTEEPHLTCTYWLMTTAAPESLPGNRKPGAPCSRGSEKGLPRTPEDKLTCMPSSTCTFGRPTCCGPSCCVRRAELDRITPASASFSRSVAWHAFRITIAILS